MPETDTFDPAALPPLPNLSREEMFDLFLGLTGVVSQMLTTVTYIQAGRTDGAGAALEATAEGLNELLDQARGIMRRNGIADE